MKRLKRKLAVVLAVCMVLTNVLSVFAEPVSGFVAEDQYTETEDSNQTLVEVFPEDFEYEKTSPSNASYSENSIDEPEETQDDSDIDAIEEATPANAKYTDEEFIRETVVDGIKITLTADPEVFPEDAELWAEKVEDEATEEAIEEAVEKERDNNANVASNIKLDIKMIVNGEEVQPDTDKGSVKVAFTLAEELSGCMEANAYHLKEEADGELTAENLGAEVKTVEEASEETVKEADDTSNTIEAIDTDEDGVLEDGVIEDDVTKTVTILEAETDGFSYYVVEFTYNKLQYVLSGDSSIALSDILAQLMIEGTVADVEVSSPELFSAAKDANGVWTVTAHQAFSSEEWMKVTIDDGNVYEITVTDSLGITTWSSLQTALSGSDGTITLEGDITAGDDSQTLTVSGTKTLDLNGHKIDGKRDGSTSVGTVIKVMENAKLTLDDLSKGKEGCITGGSSTNGGGVYVSVNAALTMKGGNIKDNTTTSNGGGVFVAGEFEMTGGSITDNEATNKNNSLGGGVYNLGTFTMTGGSIERNTSAYRGGGVSSKGTMSVDGTAKITDNTAECGGGIYLDQKGTFTMTGGSITVNTATDKGGGVYFNTNEDSSNTFTMIGGSITGNTATTSGGGMYNTNGLHDTQVTVGGTAKITGNVKGGTIADGKLSGGAANNVYLQTNKYITVGTKDNVPQTGMQIGVTAQNGAAIFTSNSAKDYKDYFSADNPDYYVNVDIGDRLELKKKEEKEVSTWGELQNAIFGADTTPTVIKLKNDIVESSRNSPPITLGRKDYAGEEVKHNIVLDLNGNKLDRNLTGTTLSTGGTGMVIQVLGQAKLTIKDSSQEKKGKITGGRNDSGGGGIFIDSEASLTLESGTITGNTAASGGGIYNKGKFTMTGGSITENTASDGSGGGVYLEGQMSVGGNAVIKNNKLANETFDSNLYVATEDGIAAGTITPDGMEIGVSTSNSPEVGKSVKFARVDSGKESDYIRYFFSDMTDYKVADGEEGWLVLKIDEKPAPQKTVGEILATVDNFPTTEANGWVNEKGNKAYIKNSHHLSVSPLGLPITYSVKASGTDYCYEGSSCRCTFTMANGVLQSITVSGYSVDTVNGTYKPGSTPKPKKSSSSNTYTFYTGTTGNPVTTGRWTQNADGTWSYSTRYKFTETWGCIADAGKPDSKAWYYFDRNGNMLTGWQKLYWNGKMKWYYFSKTKDSNEGKCQLSGITPDGYRVGADGAWIED